MSSVRSELRRNACPSAIRGETRLAAVRSVVWRIQGRRAYRNPALIKKRIGVAGPPSDQWSGSVSNRRRAPYTPTTSLVGALIQTGQCVGSLRPRQRARFDQLAIGLAVGVLLLLGSL